MTHTTTSTDHAGLACAKMYQGRLKTLQDSADVKVSVEVYFIVTVQTCNYNHIKFQALEIVSSFVEPYIVVLLIYGYILSFATLILWIVSIREDQW